MAKPNGKTAFITGSTDGVGRVVAKMLGASGWRVLVHGRDRERGERVVAEIKAGGGSAELAHGGSCFACGGAAPRRRGAKHDQPARSPHQQRRHRQRRTARHPTDECRGLRIALRGELSGRLFAHLFASAADRKKRAGADRQRLVARTGTHRIRRRDVDERLQRHARLPPEQARADHVHDRSCE